MVGKAARASAARAATRAAAVAEPTGGSGAGESIDGWVAAAGAAGDDAAPIGASEEEEEETRPAGTSMAGEEANDGGLASCVSPDISATAAAGITALFGQGAAERDDGDSGDTEAGAEGAERGCGDGRVKADDAEGTMTGRGWRGDVAVLVTGAKAVEEAAAVASEEVNGVVAWGGGGGKGDASWGGTGAAAAGEAGCWGGGDGCGGVEAAGGRLDEGDDAEAATACCASVSVLALCADSGSSRGAGGGRAEGELRSVAWGEVAIPYRAAASEPPVVRAFLSAAKNSCVIAAVTAGRALAVPRSRAAPWPQEAAEDGVAAGAEVRAAIPSRAAVPEGAAEAADADNEALNACGRRGAPSKAVKTRDGEDPVDAAATAPLSEKDVDGEAPLLPPLLPFKVATAAAADAAASENPMGTSRVAVAAIAEVAAEPAVGPPGPRATNRRGDSGRAPDASPSEDAAGPGRAGGGGADTGPEP